MILTQDLRQELMIDETGRRYYRMLSRDELFGVVLDRYEVEEPTMEQTEFLNKKLNQFGFSDAEIFDRLMFAAAGLER